MDREDIYLLKSHDKGFMAVLKAREKLEAAKYELEGLRIDGENPRWYKLLESVVNTNEQINEAIEKFRNFNKMEK